MVCYLVQAKKLAEGSLSAARRLVTIRSRSAPGAIVWSFLSFFRSGNRVGGTTVIIWSFAEEALRCQSRKGIEKEKNHGSDRANNVLLQKPKLAIG